MNNRVFYKKCGKETNGVCTNTKNIGALKEKMAKLEFALQAQPEKIMKEYSSRILKSFQEKW